MSDASFSTHAGATGSRLAFRAMGCRASVIVNGPSALLDTALARIDRLERVWSRFIDDSDISILNRSEGRPQRVAPETVRLVRAMVDGWTATRGAFDPTLLPSLIAIGDGGGTGSSAGRTLVPPGLPRRGGVASIHIAADGAVTLPAGATLDPGGIGKGLAADIVADELLDAGADGVLVDIGGDIAVRGVAPLGHGWTIAVDDDGEAVTLGHGGVATSGTERRTWTGPDGQVVHHLIDPDHLASFITSLCEVTVIAGTAGWAEVWTKYVMAESARGGDALGNALAHLDARGLAARMRHRSGAIVHNEAWTAFDARGAT